MKLVNLKFVSINVPLRDSSGKIVYETWKAREIKTKDSDYLSSLIHPEMAGKTLHVLSEDATTVPVVVENKGEPQPEPKEELVASVAVPSMSSTISSRKKKIREN